MTDAVKSPRRAYHAPQRAAAAARTRETIVAAAKEVFERLGWSGATMRGVADQAGVSIKTVEAHYGTKAERDAVGGTSGSTCVFKVVRSTTSTCRLGSGVQPGCDQPELATTTAPAPAW